jgi:hypothetical protein
VNNKFLVLLSVGIITSGLVYTHPVYAHNFGGDESASWIAKVAEIKTEANLVSKHVADNDTIDYYADALGEYWNENDTKEMGERNALLQKEIPDTINAVINGAKAGDKNAVEDNVSKLNGYLDESIPVRVDKDKINNSTVQALAVTFVLKEALEKYGDSINSTVDLNDMSQMKMNMSSTSMSGMSIASTVVNQKAYENSMGLAMTAQDMFNNLAATNQDKSDTNTKVSMAFTKLLKDLNAKADANTIMMDVHQNMHPSLITGYDIQTLVIPEFPLPALLILISIAAVVAATRLKSQIGF